MTYALLRANALAHRRAVSRMPHPHIGERQMIKFLCKLPISGSRAVRIRVLANNSHCTRTAHILRQNGAGWGHLCDDSCCDSWIYKCCSVSSQIGMTHQFKLLRSWGSGFPRCLCSICSTCSYCSNCAVSDQACAYRGRMDYATHSTTLGVCIGCCLMTSRRWRSLGMPTLHVVVDD